MTLLCYYAVFALERRFEIIFHRSPLFYENMLGYTCLFQLIYVMIIYFLFIFGKVKWLLLLLLLTFKVLFGQSFRKTAGYSEHIMFANKYRRRLLFINPFNGPFVEFFFPTVRHINFNNPFFEKRLPAWKKNNLFQKFN